MERWPVFIAIGLGIVVLVNLGFITVAIAYAPDVEPSYSNTQDR
jgi:hypothetical protein